LCDYYGFDLFDSLFDFAGDFNFDEIIFDLQLYSCFAAVIIAIAD